MKRILVLSVFLFVFALSAFSSEEPAQNTRHLSYSSSVAISNYGISWDKGDLEYGLFIRSGFPNFFNVLALDGILGGVYDLEEDDVRPYEWKDALQDLKDSFSLAYVVEGTVRKDFLKSETRDLDLGLG
ncbi:MAG: hypothetical protein KBS81_10845, partial [Spirochaetales bacterium]|nr:hypothetical protein [Candidatus Physcosoma equi]